MNILLDTNISLWSLTNDPRLPPEARDLISKEDNRIFWSVASMWEVAIKRSIKPEKMPVYGIEYMHYCEQAGYECLSVRDRHVVVLESLPSLHNDPFDRILVSQALSEGMTFLTHDSVLGGYGKEVLVY
jgi:PIN domain nuclease of toxin-antitoxin system